MSISDSIVVMKKGVVQQTGRPQAVYDDPENLFVATFLGTPPINVFDGEVKGEQLYIGGDAVLSVPDVADQPVFAAIRPEGFLPDTTGPLACSLSGIEVMGRDVSVVCTHPACQATAIRAIVSAENAVDESAETVRFALNPHKVLLFAADTQQRLRFRI